MRDRSPSDHSPILSKRKVSPISIRKAALKAANVSIDHSDDEFSSAQKLKGENPFDSSCVKAAGPQVADHMRNLFFGQKSD